MKDLKIEEVANGYLIIMYDHNRCNVSRPRHNEYVARDIAEAKKLIGELLKREDKK